MDIRKATSKDLKEIDKIHVEGCVDEVKTQYPKKSKGPIRKIMKKNKKERLKSFEKGLKDTKYCWLVAEINGKIVGFGQAKVEKIAGKLEGFLDKIYIKKEFRERGIGKALGKKIIKWLKKKKTKTVECSLFIKNKLSMGLCESLGLKPVAVRMFKELRS